MLPCATMMTWLIIGATVLYNFYRLSILFYTWKQRNNPDVDEVDRALSYEEAKGIMSAVFWYDVLLLAAFVVGSLINN
jgi:hypothetical protein